MQEYLHYKNNVDPFKKSEQKSCDTKSTSSCEHADRSHKRHFGIKLTAKYGSQLAAAIDY